MLIDLGAVFSTAYDRGRFGRRPQYQERPSAPLRAADKRWVEAVLKKEALKPKGPHKRPRP